MKRALATVIWLGAVCVIVFWAAVIIWASTH
jgi:hypothetical protein